MPASPRPLLSVVGLCATALFGGCASKSPSADPAKTGAPTAESAPAALARAYSATTRNPNKWYTATINEGDAQREFWWHTCKDKDETLYTMIAAPLDMLPSSAPGKGGITAPKYPEQGPKPLMVDYCSPTEHPIEANTLVNGFMCVLVEPKSSRQADSPWKTRWIPWPIIIRTPSHPAGAFAGTFVLLAIQDSEGSMLRESVFRPNQGKDAACDQAAHPDGDNVENLVHVAGGCCGDEYQFFLREVAGVNNFKSEVTQNSVDIPSAEATFLVDVCTFMQRAREIIVSTNEANPAKVTECEYRDRR